MVLSELSAATCGVTLLLGTGDSADSADANCASSRSPTAVSRRLGSSPIPSGGTPPRWTLNFFDEQDASDYRRRPTARIETPWSVNSHAREALVLPKRRQCQPYGCEALGFTNLDPPNSWLYIQVLQRHQGAHHRESSSASSSDTSPNRVALETIENAFRPPPTPPSPRHSTALVDHHHLPRSRVGARWTNSRVNLMRRGAFSRGSRRNMRAHTVFETQVTAPLGKACMRPKSVA